MTEQAPNGPTSEDAAEVMKSRLRTDLRSAMLAKEHVRVRVLRAVIAALDNAQAVPIGDRHARYVVHAFGDRSTEVARLALGAWDVQHLLTGEAAARTSAAEEMERLRQTGRAEELHREAAVIAEYCEAPPRS
jgi:hypothetical protein